MNIIYKKIAFFAFFTLSFIFVFSSPNTIVPSKTDGGETASGDSPTRLKSVEFSQKTTKKVSEKKEKQGILEKFPIELKLTMTFFCHLFCFYTLGILLDVKGFSFLDAFLITLTSYALCCFAVILFHWEDIFIETNPPAQKLLTH